MSTMNTNMQKAIAPSGAFYFYMRLNYGAVLCPCCGEYLGKVETHSEARFSVNCKFCRHTVVYDAKKIIGTRPIRPIITSSGRRLN